MIRLPTHTLPIYALHTHFNMYMHYINTYIHWRDVTWYHQTSNIHMYTHVYTCIHMYTHVYTCIHSIRLPIFTHIYTYIHMYTHTYTYIHIYTHIYTYIHMYTHIYTPSDFQHIHPAANSHPQTALYMHYTHTSVCIRNLYTHICICNLYPHVYTCFDTHLHAINIHIHMQFICAIYMRNLYTLIDRKKPHPPVGFPIYYVP